MQKFDADHGLEERKLGAVTVLFGQDGGKYPDGNALLVEGSEETVLIDPALGCLPRQERLAGVDRVLNSRCPLLSRYFHPIPLEYIFIRNYSF